MQRLMAALTVLLVACATTSEPLPTAYVIPTLTPSTTPHLQETQPPKPTSPPAQAATRDPSVCAPEDLSTLQEPFYSLSVDVFVTAFVSMSDLGECQRVSLGTTTSTLQPPADIQDRLNAAQGSLASSSAIDILPCAAHNKEAAIAYHQAALAVLQAVQQCAPIGTLADDFDRVTRNYIDSTTLLQSQVPGLYTVFDELDETIE